MADPKKKSLLEGFADSVGTSIRTFFARTPAASADELRRGGSPSSERAGLPYNLVSQFGYDSLAEHLRVDQDLQARFTDYEEMDEYPEISCLHGDSPVFTLERGWVQIRELVGQSFHVVSYDKAKRSLVPTEGTALLSAPSGHHKPMVRVTLDNGEQITCTADHPFLTKSEEWVEAEDLTTGQRLMPGNLRLRSLNTVDAAPYWQLHQPHSDSEIRSSDGKRWVWLHRLVAEERLGVERGEYQVVHHEDHDQLNNAPSNLSIEDRSSHAYHHIAEIDNSHLFPEWTEERRKQQAERMRGNTHSCGAKRSAAHRDSIGRAARRPKSAEHRRKIGLSQPNRIEIQRCDLEAALVEGGSVAGAAKILGVSWSTVARKAARFDLVEEGGNHRVLRVEQLDERPAVYDLHVPGFHNFVCHGVVVHNTALDIYADDSTMPDHEREKAIWIESEDDALSKDLGEVLHKRLLIEDDIWGLCRTVSKYGNAYGELLVNETGLIGINFLPPPTVRRVEGPRGELLGFIQDVKGEFNISLEDFYKIAQQRGTEAERARPPGELTVFEDWELVHWRLRGKHLRSVYGHGVIDPARWIWKRLALLEDALLIYKLSRAPSRYAFYVDVGEYDNERGLAFVNRVKNQFKKKKFVNPNTGKIDMRHNPLAHDEDFFIPTRGGKDSTRIEVLQGPDYAETETTEYHRDKLVAALKVPKTYMGYGGESSRSALSSEDIRFARTVMRIQREIRGGIRKALRVHLIAKGADVDRSEYEVKMTVPSAIMELARLEVMSATADLAERMRETVSTKWVLTNLYKFTEEEAKKLMKERAVEAKDRAKTEAAAQSIMTKADLEAQATAAPPPAEGEAEGEPEPRQPTAGAAQPAFASRSAERRLQKLMEAHRRDIDRSFNRKMKSEDRVGAKLDTLLKNNKGLAKRMKNLEGLVSDLRASL